MDHAFNTSNKRETVSPTIWPGPPGLGISSLPSQEGHILFFLPFLEIQATRLFCMNVNTKIWNQSNVLKGNVSMHLVRLSKTNSFWLRKYNFINILPLPWWKKSPEGCNPAAHLIYRQLPKLWLLLSVAKIPKGGHIPVGMCPLHTLPRCPLLPTRDSLPQTQIQQKHPFQKNPCHKEVT